MISRHFLTKIWAKFCSKKLLGRLFGAWLEFVKGSAIGWKTDDIYVSTVSACKVNHFDKNLIKVKMGF